MVRMAGRPGVCCWLLVVGWHGASCRWGSGAGAGVWRAGLISAGVCLLSTPLSVDNKARGLLYITGDPRLWAVASASCELPATRGSRRPICIFCFFVQVCSYVSYAHAPSRALGATRGARLQSRSLSIANLAQLAISNRDCNRRLLTTEIASADCNQIAIRNLAIAPPWFQHDGACS